MDDLISRLNTALDGRYGIERELGEGGMATVFLAVDRRHGRKVALKVLREGLVEAHAGERFFAEIKTAANLQHPHILPLFDSGEADGLLFYVMPYVEGETLRTKLAREGELPLDVALRIAAELAEALDYAHRRGVIHRDIKPGNILLHEGQAVISDFGIALAVDVAGGDRFTGSNGSVGTPSYMSPEQVVPAGQIDGRADVYALACVLHEMLAGEPAFTGASVRAVLAKHLAVPPTPVRTLRASVPWGVEQAILRGLEKSPVDRFSTMRDFAVALERGAVQPVSPRAVWTSAKGAVTRRPFAATVLGLALTGTVAVSASILFAGPAWDVRPTSVAVLPFRESGSLAQERTLASELADVITRELQLWDGVDVASDLDLAGPKLDMGLTEPTLQLRGDGLVLAGAVEAQAMVALTVRERGDTLVLQASMLDTRSRRRVGEPVTVSGVFSDMRDPRLTAPVVARVLGFGDAPEPSRALRAGTRVAGAAEAYLAGREALERNRLDDAEASLARAIALDSTFATALSFLGQAHFWRGVEADRYFISRGAEISRWSTSALRHIGALSSQNESHVRGFYALQLGAFDDARDFYRTIVESDSSDVYAHLMLGEIELLDPWSVRDTDGSLVPRSNLNRAQRAFTSAVRIDPTFELAYGQMFDVLRELAGGLSGSCNGFEEVGEEVRAIWQRRVPTERMYPLCPVALDSLAWIPFAEFQRTDPSVLRAGVDRYFRQARAELERWALFAPEQPRPRELLSDAFLLQRRQMGVASPERHRLLAAEALRYRSEAVALRADTSAPDHVALANLQLAAGEVGSAVEHARRALDLYSEGSGRPASSGPDELINVLVASGQAAAALSVAEGLHSGGYISTTYFPDPEGGQAISVAGGTEPLVRLRVLAASGVGAPVVRTELERLSDAWVREGYSPRVQAVLRNAVTPQIMASLSLDSVALAGWSTSVRSDDLSARDRPIWLALASSDAEPTRAFDAFSQAIGAVPTSDGSQAAFVLGVIAAKLDRSRQAIELFSRLDSIAASVEIFDSGWGLQVLSRFLRAEQYEKLGDIPAAMDHYRAFIDSRVWPDSLSAGLLAEAQKRMARLSNVGIQEP